MYTYETQISRFVQAKMYCARMSYMLQAFMRKIMYVTRACGSVGFVAERTCARGF